MTEKNLDVLYRFRNSGASEAKAAEAQVSSLRGTLADAARSALGFGKDTTDLSGKLTVLKTQVATLSEKKFQIGIDRDQLTQDIAYFRQQIAAAQTSGHGSANQQAITQYRQNIATAQAALADLRAQGRDIRVDTRQATSALKELEAASKAAGGAHKGQRNEVNLLNNGLREGTRTALEFGKASHGLSAGLSGLARGGLGPLVGIGVSLGILGELEHLSSAEAQLSTQVLQNADKWRLNTEQTQVWMRVAEEAGVGTDKLSMGFRKFNQELFSGAPALAASGLSLKSLGITSTDTGVAIGQAADYFQAHRGAVQLTTIAQNLFGRSGADLIPILEQGSSTLSKFTTELKAHGLILNQQQLEFGALANVVHKDFTESLKGAELQLGSGLQVGFIVLNAVMQKFLGEGEAGFQRLGLVVGEVVGGIAILIGKLFGITVNMTDILKEQNSALGAYSELANQGAAGADQLATKTKDATKAIQDQIKEITEQTKAQVASIDVRIRAIDAIVKEIDETKRLRDEKRQADADQDKIGKDRKAQDIALFEGNYALASTLEQQLTDDKQKAADDQTTAHENAQKAQLADAKAALEELKRQAQEVSQAKIQMLQDQLTAAQQAAAGTSAAMAASAGSVVGDMGQMGAAGDNLFTGLNRGIKDSQGKFEGMFAKLDEFLKDPGGELGKGAAELGKKIGEGILSGMGNAITNGVAQGSGKADGRLSLDDYLNPSSPLDAAAKLPQLPGALFAAATGQIPVHDPGAGVPSSGKPAGRSVTIHIDARGANPSETELAVRRALADHLAR